MTRTEAPKLLGLCTVSDRPLLNRLALGRTVGLIGTSRAGIISIAHTCGKAVYVQRHQRYHGAW